ncbi:MAG: mycothiol synthase [Acidimicrobiia bacterium]
MITVRVVHEMGASEVARVRDLLVAAEAADGHRALGEHKWLDLTAGEPGRFTGLVAEDGGRLLGYAHLSVSSAGHFGLEVAVDPAYRSVGVGGIVVEGVGVEGGGVEGALVTAALDVAAAAGGGDLQFWVFQPDHAHDALVRALGFRLGRELYQMRRSLPHPEAPRWPAGVTVRPFRPGVDDQRWLEVNNRAFATHPEQGVWTAQTLKERMGEAWFDPAGFLLAEDGEGLAGFCWTKLHRDDQLGEIHVIATDPDRQGRGLGRALVLGGLASMAARGVVTAMLYVDSANDSAVALYRRLGFDVHHADRAYVAHVVPSAGSPAGTASS